MNALDVHLFVGLRRGTTDVHAWLCPASSNVYVRDREADRKTERSGRGREM